MTAQRQPRAAARIAAALALALMAPATSAAAEGATVTISRAEARAALADALARGRPDIAWHLARGLIAADPGDFDAHAALSEAEVGLGRPAEAARSARMAARLARGPNQRFEAALLRAQAAEAQGSTAGGVAAMFWARRAVELAPLDAYRHMASGELSRLRAASPLQLQFSLSLAPSSNVNNGSRRSHVELPGWGGLLWELSPQSRALSGWVGEAAVAGRYQLRASNASASFLQFSAQRREVRLSRDSRDLLTAWRNDEIAAGRVPPPMPDYDYGQVELGLQHYWRAGPATLNLGATVGHNWFGGRDLSDYLRLEAGAERGLDDRTALFGGLVLERHWRKSDPGSDVAQLRGGVQRLTATGDRLRLSAEARNTASASVDQRHRALGLRLGWEKAQAVAGIGIEASLHAEARRYAPSMLAPGGRQDMRIEATLSLRLDRFDYMGFVPVVNLNASRVNSNVGLHDGSDAGITLGFRSRF